MKAVTVEGVPSLPLIARRQINAQHQPGPHHAGLTDGLGDRLEAAVAVPDMLSQAGATGDQAPLVAGGLRFLLLAGLVEIIHEIETSIFF